MLEKTKEKLQSHGYSIAEIKDLNGSSGKQIRLTNGGVVCVYSTGSIVCQGKPEIKSKLEELVRSDEISSGHKQITRDIFVVYGHDTNIRTEWEATLRKWGLNPLILDQLPSEGHTIIEKLISYKDKASFAVVIATPDDWGYKDGHKEDAKPRARQNVVLELGMMLATLGRSKVAVLMKNATGMEKPSDIDGLVYISLDNFSEAKLALSKEMHKQGISVALGDL